jgi:hypothetical protein
VVAFQGGDEIVGRVEGDVLDVVEVDQVFAVGAEEEFFGETVFE